MKPFRFPYAIAAEFWLFGPPAKKQTAVHLFILIALFGSGTILFAILEDRIGRLLAVLSAIPVGLIVGYGFYWLFAQVMPALHWLVSRGIIESPDEKRFRDKIIWTACWKTVDSKEEKPTPSQSL